MKYYFALKWIVLSFAWGVFAPASAALPNRVLQLGEQGDYLLFPPGVFDALEEATVEMWAKWEDFGYFSQIFGSGPAAEERHMGLSNPENRPDLRLFMYAGHQGLKVVDARNILVRH